MLSALIASS